MAADRLGGCVGGEFTKPFGFRAITLGVMFVLVQLCTSLFAPRRCSLSVTIKRRDKGKARQSLTTKKPGSGLPGRAIVIEAGLKAGTIPIRDTKPEPSGGMGDKGGPPGGNSSPDSTSNHCTSRHCLVGGNRTQLRIDFLEPQLELLLLSNNHLTSAAEPNAVGVGFYDSSFGRGFW